ncbi:MAG: hypothetical protein ACK5LE_02640 [Alphaproteobacteria bacterium]
MRIVIRGLVIFVLLAIAAVVGLLSFTASLNPQPQIERVIVPVTPDQYQAPDGSADKVFTETLREQEQAVTTDDTATNTEIAGTENEDTEAIVSETTASENTQAENTEGETSGAENIASDETPEETTND